MIVQDDGGRSINLLRRASSRPDQMDCRADFIWQNIIESSIPRIEAPVLMPLSVALLTTILSPRAGGLSASVPALARCIADCGADVHVLGVRDPLYPDLETHWGPSVLGFKPFPLQPIGYAPGYSEALGLLSPQITDVQGLWMYPSLANVRYHSRTGTPYIVTPRGMLDPWAIEHSAWKKRAVRLWFEDKHLKAAACLRATAEMEAVHFRRFGLQNPIAIVPNSIEIPSVTPIHPEKTRRSLLFLSRIHPKKGLAFLLRAWSRVSAHRPDWDLVIAGPDERNHLADMKRLAQELGLPRVTWLGEQHGDEKSALYQNADLFVLPTHAENFGLVIAEALAHGVPVVTTRNAPWSGLITNRCGWWIDLTDSALVDVLLAATSLAPAALNVMGSRGRAWMARDFGKDRVAEWILQVYEWVVHGGSQPPTVHLS